MSASGLASTLSRATSVDGSLPTSVAFRVSSFEKRTSIEVAPSMTWKFVTMWPSLSSTKPEPSAWRGLLELAVGRGRGTDRARDLDDARAHALVDLVDRQSRAGNGGNRAGRRARLLLDDRRRAVGVERADRCSATEGDTAAEHRRGREQREGPAADFVRGGLPRAFDGGVRSGSGAGSGVGAVGQLEVSIRLCYTGRRRKPLVSRC